MHNHIRFDIVISCNKLQQTLLFSVYLILNFFILKSDAIAICFQLGKICNSIHFFVFLYVYIIKVQFVDIQLTLLYGHPV